MSFIFAEDSTHRIIDIVKDRRYYHLEKYFKQCFSNAKIITDRFHILNLLSRFLNKTRIKAMNSNKDNYNKFKKYRKLILKWDNDLDSANLNRQPSFKKMMTQKDIFNHLVSQDKELENTYKLYQSILNCMKYKKGDLLNNLKYTDISSYMQTAIDRLPICGGHTFYT